MTEHARWWARLKPTSYLWGKQARCFVKTNTIVLLVILWGISKHSLPFSVCLVILTFVFLRKWFEPRSNIPWLKKIIWVIGVLRRTVFIDWRFLFWDAHNIVHFPANYKKWPVDGPVMTLMKVRDMNEQVTEIIGNTRVVTVTTQSLTWQKKCIAPSVVNYHLSRRNLPSISASAVPGLGLFSSINASFFFSVAINGELGLHPGLVHWYWL